MSILHVKVVRKHFAGLRALDDVNLAVEEGSIHAIIGPNGAGKSTLLNCFVGRLTPDAGSVTFAGQSLVGLQPHEINQAGGVRVFQTPAIFGEVTPRYNVLVPPLARLEGAFRCDSGRRLRRSSALVLLSVLRCSQGRASPAVSRR